MKFDLYKTDILLQEKFNFYDINVHACSFNKMHQRYQLLQVLYQSDEYANCSIRAYQMIYDVTMYNLGFTVFCAPR